MIIFINFAPIEFMGGAEKWMLNISSEVCKYEDVILIDVTESISSIYASLILKRKFINNLVPDNTTKLPKRLTLTIRHFIPFTREWKNARNTVLQARLIYIKFEILEYLICLYFGGIQTNKKIVAGIISALQYARPQNIIDILHNKLYASTLYKRMITSVRKVHVLNLRDYKYLTSKYKLENVIQLYVGINIQPLVSFKNAHKNILKIIVVGELSLRKGTDLICDIARLSPDNFEYTVIGDGPLKNDIRLLEKAKKCRYLGYVKDPIKLNKEYERCDVLLFPSRAETMGLVIPEAMMYGLRIISSKFVSLNLPSYIESVGKENVSEYIELLNKVYLSKKENKINKVKIHQYAIDHFSKNILYPKFMRDVLNINI